ncbi:MAG: MtnX-like HAD-IB family phosphatase [Desulfobacteraceae bacterium]|nr:MtnX-like HAD-IB family phosphatase [Desulfobacteraceae bacterium]
MADSGGGNKPYVFCDFDGTITSQETLQGVFEHFLPDKWNDMKQKLRSGSVTLRSGVREMLESIPSERYHEALSFVRKIPLRSGFEEFLDFLEQRGIPFVILSGGVRGMVEAGLGPLIKRIHRVFAADVDDAGQYLKVNSEFEGGTELVAKAEVMKRFDADPRIVIGDGRTDFNMAKEGDLVFARDGLARYLEKNGAEYISWSDFTDVLNELKEFLERGRYG